MLERWWAKDVDLIKDNGRETERQVLNSFGLKYRPAMARVKVVKYADLLPVLRAIHDHAHGGAMLGGDHAYQACLEIMAQATKLIGDATKGVEG